MIKEYCIVGFRISRQVPVAKKENLCRVLHYPGNLVRGRQEKHFNVTNLKYIFLSHNNVP